MRYKVFYVNSGLNELYHHCHVMNSHLSFRNLLYVAIFQLIGVKKNTSTPVNQKFSSSDDQSHCHCPINVIIYIRALGVMMRAQS